MSQTCQQPQAHPARCGCVQTPSIEMMEQGSLAANYDISQETAGKVWEAMENSRKLRAAMPHAGGEVEVQRFWAEDARNIRCVREADFDSIVTRLQAENAALQQRLTIADQRVDDLQSVVEQVLTNAERGLPPDLHRTLRKLVPEPASTQPVDEAEREPFEAWHRRRFKTKYSTGAPTRDIHGSVPDPNYGPPNQQQMWEAWNARAALLIPRDHEIPGTSFQRLNALANEGE